MQRISKIPEKLQILADVPQRLFYKGDLSLLEKPAVSIVGTRKPCAYTKEMTMQLAQRFSAIGYAVVSGAAMGVDALAHRGAMPSTIAVMANSLDIVYPKVNQRLIGALTYGIIPVLCIGETLDEREDGLTWEVLREQILSGLEGVSGEQAAKVVLAYEPVWAIGTGKTASKEQAQEAHQFIRGLIEEVYEKKLAEQMRILYGGSVKPDNVDDLMRMPDVDGALVGGAALQADSFDRIIHFS